MANTYFDLTGVLILDKVTPVIEAVFGAHELDGKHPGDGQAYIASIAESTNSSWESLLENLVAFAESNGLSTTDEAGNDVGSIGEVLKILAPHFNASENVELDRLIEDDAFDLDDSADFASLFVIAKAFDDGHGLTAIKTEAAWHCDKPLLFAFGGSGYYVGTHFYSFSASHEVNTFGQRIEEALGKDQHYVAALAIKEHVNKLLSGIRNDEARQDVRNKLATILNVGDTNPNQGAGKPDDHSADSLPQ